MHTLPSGLTGPDGHAIVKWVADDGTEMEPGELLNSSTLMD